VYIVRKFEPKDMFVVIKIASDTLSEKYNPAIFNYFYETYPDLFIVAELGKKIIGFIIGIKINKKISKILMLTVSKKYRKKNIASSLLNQFENTILKENITQIELEVSILNKNAIKFYQKRGYIIKEKISNYYQNNEDAYIMKKYFSF
jgi:ribosomal protein S18 acetylase RimI-like enzyme